MNTWKRICVKDWTITDGRKVLHLKRGKEYLTSGEQGGTVTVFSKYWASGVPVHIFAAEVVFTKDREPEPVK